MLDRFAFAPPKPGLDAAAAFPGQDFYFLGGFTEGTETVTSCVAMCVWPWHFDAIAYVFAAQRP